MQTAADTAAPPPAAAGWWRSPSLSMWPFALPFVAAITLAAAWGSTPGLDGALAIGAALIVALMFAGGAEARSLARDTVFAAIMIVANGVVGLCLVVGGVRHHALRYRVEGTRPALVP